jgi:hypothetical protein
LFHDVHGRAPIVHVHMLIDPPPHRLHGVIGDCQVPDAGSAPEFRKLA